jgi:hypothetical protein
MASNLLPWQQTYLIKTKQARLKDFKTNRKDYETLLCCPDQEKELLFASMEGEKGNVISQSEMDQKEEE